MARKASKIIYVILPRSTDNLDEIPKTHIAKLDAGTTPLINEKLIIHYALGIGLFPEIKAQYPHVDYLNANFDEEDSNTGVIYDEYENEFTYFTVIE